MIDFGPYDADKWQLCLSGYARKFGHAFSQKVAPLEVAVQGVGSMCRRRDLFPRGQFASLDLKPARSMTIPTAATYITGFSEVSSCSTV
ncbi:MAG: hypothetical protein QOH91_3412 [Mycobacterium sp.]|jgi:hypothetical protein|nr:hypothetical protein [Mycobacterium sp.]